MHLIRLIAAGLIIVLVSGPSSAQGWIEHADNKIASLPVSPFDDELRVQIATRIYRDPLFWNYAIQPAPPIHIIENGHVTLKGVVDSEVERRVAETIARSAFGVFEVNNLLQLERDVRAAN